LHEILCDKPVDLPSYTVLGCNWRWSVNGAGCTVINRVRKYQGRFNRRPAIQTE
jgi:hypothetical protein